MSSHHIYLLLPATAYSGHHCLPNDVVYVEWRTRFGGCVPNYCHRGGATLPLLRQPGDSKSVCLACQQRHADSGPDWLGDLCWGIRMHTWHLPLCSQETPTGQRRACRRSLRIGKISCVGRECVSQDRERAGVWERCLQGCSS